MSIIRDTIDFYRVPSNMAEGITIFDLIGTGEGGGTGGDNLVWSPINIDITATINNGYFVDTTTGPVTITLPATATIGDAIGITDYAGLFNTNNCIINRNGHNIMGLADDLICDINHLSIELIYSDATQGWKISETFASGTMSGSSNIWNSGVHTTSSTGPDTSTATIEQLSNTLNTLIEDLKLVGILKSS